MKFSSLNEKQLEATTLTEGPIIVIAGAGSGKTRVLTYRISYLVEQGIPVDNILAITFTNKAAKEMRDRVFELIGTRDIWISTFHSMCIRILRKHATILGYDRGFNILDDGDQVSLVRKIIKDNDIEIVSTPKSIVSMINHMKNGRVYELPEVVQNPLDFIYTEYHKYIKKNNLMDFEDLLLRTVDLFKASPDTLAIYQEKFQYILVDEYQDTNDIQNKLIIMLGAKHKNIFLVGDEDQSIYKFRGANYKNLANFENTHKKTKVIKLEQNYRSTKNILDAANGVISNNSTKHKKNLWTSKDAGEKITYFRAITDGDESLFISNEVNMLVNSGVHPAEIAILYRSNFMSRKIEEGMRFLDVPYIVYGGVGYFKRKEVKNLISYLKLIVNQQDNWSLSRIINEPKRKIGNVTVDRMLAVAGEQGEFLFNVCVNAKEFFPKGLATKLTNFAKIILELKESIEKFDLIEFIDQILDKTGYGAALLLEGDEGIFRLDNINEFKSIIQNYSLEGLSNIDKLQVILEDLSLQIDSEASVEESVKLMTMHNSKGLEFDYVFVYGVEEGLFPSSRSMDSNEDIEEERRLAYVAITRARMKLYITNACARTVYGQATTNPASRFISEIPSELVDFRGNRTDRTKPLYKINRKVQPHNDDTYRLGDKVRHKMFGDGLIVSLDTNNISIAFKAPFGIKKLIKNHPTIEKIDDK